MSSRSLIPPGVREGALSRLEWLLEFRSPTTEEYAQAFRMLAAADLREPHDLLAARYQAAMNGTLDGPSDQLFRQAIERARIQGRMEWIILAQDAARKAKR